MKTFSLRFLTVCAAFALTASAGAQAGAQTDVQSPTAVPPHDTFTIRSAAVGEQRTINVFTPSAYNIAQARLQVLYMPDGGVNEDFPHVVHTVDSLIRVRAIRPTIVVGIPNTERRRDLTGPTRVKSDSAIAPRVGQSAAFRKFVRDELIPEIDKRYRTTTERAIIGESLAGLFVVETFLTEPDLFTHYVALDASTWWNAGALIDAAPQLLKTFDNKPRSLFLGLSDIKEMGEGVKRLDQLLRTNTPQGLTWKYEQRFDLQHDTIFRALEGAALAQALK